MLRRPLSLIIVGLFVATCGSATPTASPPIVTLAPTPVPTPTAPPPTFEPTLAPTPAPTSPFDGQAYSLDLPAGWQIFDLEDPAGAAALDAFKGANPSMAAAIDAFQKLPNVVLAIDPILGNVMVSLSIPTRGLSLEVIGTSFTAQFTLVPGVVEPPAAESVTLPVGPAIHWLIAIETNNPAGGTNHVNESVYLLSSATTAVLVEFVEITGAGVPQEQQIINTLKFTP